MLIQKMSISFKTLSVNLVKGKTLIVVAHRLATIQKADQILVVENGKIVGCRQAGRAFIRMPTLSKIME